MQYPKIIWIFLPVLAVFLSCNGQKKVAMDESTEQSVVSSLTLVTQNNYAGTDTAVTHVIESQKALAKFYSTVNRTRKPGIPVPEVDFSKHMVVIYCSGTEGNGTIPTLKLADDNSSELVFEMTNKITDDGKKNTVSPFNVYTILLTSKKINFRASE